MTERDVYEACLIELNKVLAPALLLDDFVYMFNKALYLYVNKRYNLFEIQLQMTDDLRVLIKTHKIIPLPNQPNDAVFGDSELCILPNDYFHILNCICEFQDNENKCNANSTIRIGANKMNTNLWSLVITNYYMRPSVKKPYYYITNILDAMKENQSYNKDGNSLVPTMLIKYGDSSRYTLKAVYVEYLKTPKYLSLNMDDLDKIDDNTSVIEFPDYVIYEIINEIVKLVMENGKDLRLLTFIPVNLSIPSTTAQSK